MDSVNPVPRPRHHHYGEQDTWQVRPYHRPASWCAWSPTTRAPPSSPSTSPRTPGRLLSTKRQNTTLKKNLWQCVWVSLYSLRSSLQGVCLSIAHHPVDHDDDDEESIMKEVLWCGNNKNEKNHQSQLPDDPDQDDDDKVSNNAMKRTTMTTNPNFQLKKQNNPSYQFCLLSPTTLLSIISSGSVELELRKRK